MSSFPLYTSLIKDIKEVDLTPTQKKSFIKKMELVDKKGHELVYALIKIYQLENNDKNTSFTLPYGGSFNESDVVFDLDELPNKLKQIIFKFLNIHLLKMSEETNR